MENKKIAEQEGVALSTVYSTIKRYKQLGEASYETKKQSGRPQKYNPNPGELEQLHMLTTANRECREKTLSQLVVDFQVLTGIQVNRRTMRRYLRQYLYLHRCWKV